MIDCRNLYFNGRIELECLALGAGQFWHVLGPNGSGKSSLFSLLAGLETPERGQVCLDGKCLSTYSLHLLAQRRCLLTQHTTCAFSLSVREMLSFFSISYPLNVGGVVNKDIDSPVIPKELMDALSLADLIDSEFEKLSGGQQQRVQIARCLIQVWPAIQEGRAVIILDEPLASLDIPFQHRLMSLCQALCDIGNVVLLSSHDINISAKYASHVLLLKNAQLVASGEVKATLSEAVLTQTFDHRFSIISGSNEQASVFVST